MRHVIYIMVILAGWKGKAKEARSLLWLQNSRSRSTSVLAKPQGRLAIPSKKMVVFV